MKSVSLVMVLLLIIAMPGTAAADTLIPDWIKRVTGWYSEGIVSDQEFIAFVDYILEHKVIHLGEPDYGNPELTEGKMTRVIDGNTVVVDGKKIRLSLVDVIDSGNKTAAHAVLARQLCPADTRTFYDKDDGQKEGSYGRIIAVVYCNSGVSLNELVIEFGLGWINEYFCKISEFQHAEWTMGCMAGR